MFPDHVPVLFAHRGASLEFPENTLPAFERALEFGADVLELDVHLSADGHLIVFHDDDGQRLVGVPDSIARTPLARIAEWRVRGPNGTSADVPTLDDVLRAFPDTPLNVDLKSSLPACVPTFLALLASHKAGERVCAASFSGRTLAALRAHGHRGPICASRAEVFATWLGFVPASLRTGVRRAQVPTHAAGLRLVDAAFVRRLRLRGVAVDVWTVDDPDECRALLALGVTGIMTNDPRRLAPVVAEARRARSG